MSRKKQDKDLKALRFAQESEPNHWPTSETQTTSNRLHPYNLPRATQHRFEIGHVPEITGHVRRNTQRGSRESLKVRAK